MMKNYFFTASLMLLATAGHSQNPTIDFESITLQQDTFQNNAPSGYFDFGFFRFSNSYDSIYNYNNGFSISNMRNDSVGDYTNSHSVISASGLNSSNYAMFYGFGSIVNTSQAGYIRGLYINNSTYAHSSMTNGDFVGKKFGSPNNAGGLDDGTNGEDFLRVIFEGVDAQNNVLDSVVFYLADFRFADNSLDYIVNTWQYVDLLPLSIAGPLSKINIYMESSDNHPQYGMNTPAYFGIDDFTYDYTVGLDELNEKLTFGPNPVVNNLSINGIFESIVVTNASGKVVFNQIDLNNPTVDFGALPKGMYLLTAVKNSRSQTVKIVK